jgi:hypothetical protein
LQIGEKVLHNVVDRFGAELDELPTLPKLYLTPLVFRNQQQFGATKW